MTDYSHPKYKDLYAHIVEYHNFRYGKFSEIPYPNSEDIVRLQSKQSRGNRSG